ncbi:energy transducer TonB [Pseudoalteromonas sp. S3776]|uniref:energy transducer TonB n=1 Tax=unclassified Pseudoalteromonas TaxID=194690 RepID=UPI0011099F17|nr:MULTISPECIES: energy transducer TonB [unclassified Pseudoalteromonas]TMO72695.1 energy transducer TonB [Pseudoalteromonas sp. S3785]TMO81033.1 energy transducer TonB [Pseudoalteromonas sp. S3776]
MKKRLLTLSLASTFTLPPVSADDFVPAQVINKNYDQLTNTSPRASRLEGINLSSYVVDENGQVSDIEIVATAGQKKYQREAIDYVSKLNYKSARINGNAVPTAKTIKVSSQNVHASFSNDQASPGFFDDYKKASQLIDDKKYDEAKTYITELENEHTKNTVEIVLLAWLKSQYSYFVKDWEKFDKHIYEAFLFRDNLPDQIKKRVIKNALQWFISKQDFVRAYDAIDALDNIDSIIFSEQNKAQLLAQVNDIYKNSGEISQQISLESEQAVLPLLSKSEVELKSDKPLSKVQLRCENKVVNYDLSTIDKIEISKNDVRCGLLIKSTFAQTVTLKQSGKSFL